MTHLNTTQFFDAQSCIQEPNLIEPLVKKACEAAAGKDPERCKKAIEELTQVIFKSELYWQILLDKIKTAQRDEKILKNGAASTSDMADITENAWNSVLASHRVSIERLSSLACELSYAQEEACIKVICLLGQQAVEISKNCEKLCADIIALQLRRNQLFIFDTPKLLLVDCFKNVICTEFTTLSFEQVVSKVKPFVDEWEKTCVQVKTDLVSEIDKIGYYNHRVHDFSTISSFYIPLYKVIVLYLEFKKFSATYPTDEFETRIARYNSAPFTPPITSEEYKEQLNSFQKEYKKLKPLLESISNYKCNLEEIPQTSHFLDKIKPDFVPLETEKFKQVATERQKIQLRTVETQRQIELCVEKLESNYLSIALWEKIERIKVLADTLKISIAHYDQILLSPLSPAIYEELKNKLRNRGISFTFQGQFAELVHLKVDIVEIFSKKLLLSKSRWNDLDSEICKIAVMLDRIEDALRANEKTWIKNKLSTSCTRHVQWWQAGPSQAPEIPSALIEKES